mgnify:CR=1 FL=1
MLSAVTCSVQATLLTGLAPSGHGVVGNGWYFRELGEPLLWRQSNALVCGEKVWETARDAMPCPQARGPAQTRRLGRFPLFQYWGPGAGIASSAYTLPVIRTLGESAELRGLLGRPLGEETVERAGAIILAGDAIATSQSTAESSIRKAIEAMATHRQALDEPVFEGLEGLCRLVLHRSK